MNVMWFGFSFVSLKWNRKLFETRLCFQWVSKLEKRIHILCGKFFFSNINCIGNVRYINIRNIFDELIIRYILDTNQVSKDHWWWNCMDDSNTHTHTFHVSLEFTIWKIIEVEIKVKLLLLFWEHTEWKKHPFNSLYALDLDWWIYLLILDIGLHR